MRAWGTNPTQDTSLWWPIISRNKRSVTADLHHEEGRQLVRRLAATADILVENFRPGTLEKWGLGFDALSAVNPGLVLVRVTGYGQSGPYASRAGYGSIAEALGGLRYITGDPKTPPSRTGISLGDAVAAMFAAIGALAAVNARRDTGRGQVVDVALYESVLALMESLLPEYAVRGEIRERHGSILPGVAPSNLYPTAEGSDVLLAANQDTVFARLATAMGQPELATDARYATHAARAAHQTELDELIAAWTARLRADDLLELMERNGVPASKIYRAPEMLTDPHFAARESIVTLLHPVLGDVPMANVHPRLSDTPGKVRWMGPSLGEHNAEVYGKELGLKAEELAELSIRGII